MRELYASRLHTLHKSARLHLADCFHLPAIEAGLNTLAYLKIRLTSRQAELAAAAQGVQSFGLDRFCRERRDIRGLLLGFAAFNEAEIAAAVQLLGRACR
jgi:GntR family transcriptional regulator/MocR family aminotransferase